jgi:hypothetical protein
MTAYSWSFRRAFSSDFRTVFQMTEIANEFETAPRRIL